MSNNLNLKTGDAVVRCGKVLKAFKVNENTAFLKPFFASNSNHGGLTYSLPLKNLTMTKIRKIVSTKTLNTLFESILHKAPKKNETLTIDIQKPQDDDNLEQTMRTIKTLWLEKKLGTLPGSKSTMYRQAMDQSIEEVAAVRGLSLVKARAEIVSALRAGGEVNN
jgi:RNA polymerase-interacting CarD/CdnL/TRCF family regulator